MLRWGHFVCVLSVCPKFLSIRKCVMFCSIFIFFLFDLSWANNYFWQKGSLRLKLWTGTRKARKFADTVELYLKSVWVRT